VTLNGHGEGNRHSYVAAECVRNNFVSCQNFKETVSYLHHGRLFRIVKEVIWACKGPFHICQDHIFFLFYISVILRV